MICRSPSKYLIETRPPGFYDKRAVVVVPFPGYIFTAMKDSPDESDILNESPFFDSKIVTFEERVRMNVPTTLVR